MSANYSMQAAGESYHMTSSIVGHEHSRNAAVDFLSEDPAEDSTNVVEQEDVPPNGGYGWVCVACVFLINANTWGVNSAYGVFLAFYLSHNTFPSATAIQYAFIGGLSISQALLVSPFITFTNRKYGIKVTMCIGLILETAALLGASFATQVWQLFLSQGICFGWGMGFLYVGSAAVVPRWFSTRRSLATGITAAGAGIGGLVYNLGTNAGIQSIGLAWTLRTLALSQLLVNTICTILLKERPSTTKPNQLAFDYRLFGKVPILLILGWGVFSELGYVVLYYSMPDYATSIGLSSQQGAVIGALLNLGQGIGRPLVGWFSDEVGRINIASATTALCGVFCLLIWTFAKGFSIVCFFAFMVGTVCGTYWSCVAPVCGEVVGMKDLSSALIAEAIALKLRRDSGNVYLDAQMFTGAAFFVAAFCSWGVRTWKINDVKSKRDARIDQGDGTERTSEARSIWEQKLYSKMLTVIAPAKV
ncbi:hypothetical protein BP6252_13595 [Coleophoma cylindrospora]|uniref:Major facilitator superfamily (MFS) profile domain-containing protein n=1 Tax=Coleophoma cylindrospora TaxID=1849047 RepID=A0A3D8Q9Q1_9HELO|nr:hypothetical protein BP6252_13595 [Coleophoma cylindrospora]